MFEECVLELWLEIATRGRLINLISAYLHILSVALHLPALWLIVTETIYDVRESNNFPRTYAPYFSTKI